MFGVEGLGVLYDGEYTCGREVSEGHRRCESGQVTVPDKENCLF